MTASGDPEHLDAYLNEFTFRFNRRASMRRGLLFFRLPQQAAVTGLIACRKLIATPRPGSRRPQAPAGRPRQSRADVLVAALSR